MPGVRKNFAYNFLLTVSGYIFPLITYPYISRVLGVDNIGVCNFVDSVINYFVLFSQLGIGSYGVREVARCKDDPERLKEVFSNLFFLNLITFVVSAIVLVICTFTVPKFLAYKPFLLVGLFKLLFTLILVDWFFQGIEQFRFITIRTIVVKFLYVIGVFVFIRDSGDALIYYMLTTGMVVLNAILNWHWSKRFTKLSFKGLHPLPFIVPILVFGYYRILTSMYTTFNVVFLGFVKNDVEVGYFSQATKLYSLIMATFSAFTTVMVPRVSAMIGEGRQKELQGVVDRIVQLLVSLAVPAIVYCVANAESIVHLVSGPGYEGAELPFRIVADARQIVGAGQGLPLDRGEQLVLLRRRLRLRGGRGLAPLLGQGGDHLRLLLRLRRGGIARLVHAPAALAQLDAEIEQQHGEHRKQDNLCLVVHSTASADPFSAETAPLHRLRFS